MGTKLSGESGVANEEAVSPRLGMNGARGVSAERGLKLDGPNRTGPEQRMAVGPDVVASS